MDEWKRIVDEAKVLRGPENREMKEKKGDLLFNIMIITHIINLNSSFLLLLRMWPRFRDLSISGSSNII